MVVFEFTKECECVRGKSVKGLKGRKLFRGSKKGAVHVQTPKQNFTDELLILVSLPLALPLVPPQRLAPLGHVFEAIPQRSI
jgi:hypothetical protein